MKRLDNANRTIASVVGLLLTAAGGYGIMRAFAIPPFGDRDSGAPFLLEDVQDFVADNDAWFWWAALALALLLAYLGYRWLRAQLSPSASLKELTVFRSDEGRTLLPARSVAEAVTRDLENDRDVNSARVRMVGSESRPALDVRATVSDTADPATVRARIENDIVGRARAALERDDVGVKLRLKLGDPVNRQIV